MKVISLDEFEQKYQHQEHRFLFRGQDRDYKTILSGIYRDLWTYKKDLPEPQILGAATDESTFTFVPSKDIANELVANELVAYKVRADRFFRFGFPLTRFMSVFYPEFLKSIQSETWQPIFGHIMAFHQHLGLKTHYLDVTWDPIVAAWFACHKWYESEGKYKPVDITDQPVVYIFDKMKIKDRVRDLGILPEFMLRPARQSGAVIVTSFVEDLSHQITEKILLDPSGLVEFFASRNISESFLFPNDEDPVFEFYKYWLDLGCDFPLIMNCIEGNPKSALYKLYKKRRRQIIITLCMEYDAFRVRDVNNSQIIVNHVLFDTLKMAADLSDFFRKVKTFPSLTFGSSPDLLKNIYDVSGDPYAVNWDMLDSPLYFSSENFGNIEKHPFADEHTEINMKQKRAINLVGNSYQINWKKT